MQKFDLYESMISDVIDDQFGEQVSVEPRADGEFVTGQVDPNRPATTIEAIVDYNPTTMQNRRSGRESEETSELIGERIHVSVRNSHLPYKLTTGDRITFVSRPGAPTVVVSTAEPDGIGRTVYRCKPGRNTF